MCLGLLLGVLWTTSLEVLPTSTVCSTSTIPVRGLKDGTREAFLTLLTFSKTIWQVVNDDAGTRSRGLYVQISRLNGNTLSYILASVDKLISTLVILDDFLQITVYLYLLCRGIPSSKVCCYYYDSFRSPLNLRSRKTRPFLDGSEWPEPAKHANLRKF